MKCTEIKELISAYANDELLLTQKQFVEEHLVTCIECRAALVDYRMIRKKLQNIKMPEAKAGAAEAIMAKIKTTNTKRKVFDWARPAFITVPVVIILITVAILHPWSSNTASQTPAVNVATNTQNTQVITSQLTTNTQVTQATTGVQVGVSWANYYPDFESLYSTANLIVSGQFIRISGVDQVLAAEPSWGYEYIYFTDYLFQIDTCIKGESPTTITIRQTGAVAQMELMDDPLFKIGESVILFLQEGNGNGYFGKYVVIGGPQGRFEVIDGKVYSMNNINPGKEAIAQGLNTNGVDKQSFINSINKVVNETSK